jgi:hypothetical protein
MKRLMVIAAAAILSVALAAPAAADTTREIRGVVTGEVTYADDTGCPLEFRTVSDASGWFLHMGKTAMHSEHCFTPPNLLVGGSMTFTAANGDQLFTSYNGTATPAMPAVIGELVRADFEATITGGTGRFAGATGHLAGLGWITFPGWEPPAWPGTWYLDGTIRY